MIQSIYIVIMAGGIGSRFWPYSRHDQPKQFIDVLGTGKSLLQLTYNRFSSLTTSDKILVVTNQKYHSLVKDQLPQLEDDHILLEPNRRNTAPCIAYASYKIKAKDENAVLVVTPSDHAVFNESSFLSSIRLALESAGKNDRLITLGINPNRPETGYGYIQYIDDDSHDRVKKVKTFTEKPNRDLAQTFLGSGDFVWNAGIFVWSVQSIATAFEQHLPEIADAFAHYAEDYYSANEAAAIKKAYSQCKNISIDYGIIEKASNVYVVMGDFNWSDLGSWNSLHELREQDNDNNVIDANAILNESSDNYIKADKDKLVVVQGLKGYLVADFDDVLLICEKDNEAKFRTFVNEVKAKKGDRFL